ncbi:MAG: hypothetical protein GZ085_11335 [Sulfuriferula multivorans]|uniref:Carboxypeptidase regulatory-like domain-containing protein n=1 Tax=Sulfuriferula multivorans TaxID=1559896 RepID=A0A7C9P8V7_9PROT|nr:hypothetical protein [Sulfuriferula multivorans]
MRLPYIFISGLAAFALLVPSGTSFAQIFFKSSALSASVIDADTSEPVSGAVVVALWNLEKPRFLHGHDYEVLKKIETLTDQSGRFSLEAWGPKFVWPSWRMDGGSPYVYILKSGYQFEIIGNYSDDFARLGCPGSQFAKMTRGIPTHTNSLVVVSGNTCQIILKRPTEAPEEYASRLSMIRRDLCDSRDEAQCGNALIEYFAAEKQRLLKLGAKRADW